LGPADGFLAVLPLLLFEQCFDLLTPGPPRQELGALPYNFDFGGLQPGLDARALPAGLFHDEDCTGAAGGIRIAETSCKASASQRVPVRCCRQFAGDLVALADRDLELHTAQLLFEFSKPKQPVEHTPFGHQRHLTLKESA
jgi:hypothetical protein